MENPDAAADILVAENPGVFDANPELPRASQRYLVDKGFLVDESGKFGNQTLERWQGYSKFLFDHGLLVDADEMQLTAPLDYNTLFTNDFLP